MLRNDGTPHPNPGWLRIQPADGARQSLAALEDLTPWIEEVVWAGVPASFSHFELSDAGIQLLDSRNLLSMNTAGTPAARSAHARLGVVARLQDHLQADVPLPPAA